MTDAPALPLTLLQRQLTAFQTLVEAVSAEQAGLPTPCPGWTVGRLVNHVIDDLGNFTVAAEGGTPDWGQSPSQVPAGAWATMVGDEAQELMQAWSEAPAASLGGVDMQLTELAVHTWDLGSATGHPVSLDTDIVEHCLSWGRGALTPERRGAAGGPGFAAEVTVDASAPATDRLIGWSGRDPRWSATTA